jgi:hypothetical protein
MKSPRVRYRSPSSTNEHGRRCKFTYNLAHHFGICGNVCSVIIDDSNRIEGTVEYRPSVGDVDAALETWIRSVQRLPCARGLLTVDLSLVRQDPEDCREKSFVP